MGYYSDLLLVRKHQASSGLVFSDEVTLVFEISIYASDSGFVI